MITHRLLITAAGALAALSLAPAAPALAAQKKAEAPEAPKRDLSKPFLTALGPYQKALEAKDYATASAAVEAARPLANNADERYIVDRVALDIATARNDAAAQTKALTGILASGAAPAKEQAVFNTSLATRAFDAKDYAAAMRYAQAAKAAGATDPNLDLIVAQVQAGQENYPDAIRSFRALIAADEAAGRKAPEGYYSRVAQYAYKVGEPQGLNTALRDWIKAYPSPKTWHDAVLTSLAVGKYDPGAQLDYLRLLRAADAMTKDEWRSYAELASYANLNGEVVAVVDAGKAAGTLNPSDVQEFYSRAKAKSAADRASLVNEAKAAPSKTQAQPIAAVADALSGYGDYAAAIPLYQSALSKPDANADEVNTRLGIAQALSGDYAAAKASFAKVRGARQPLAGYWSLWADQRAGA